MFFEMLPDQSEGAENLAPIIDRLHISEFQSSRDDYFRHEGFVSHN